MLFALRSETIVSKRMLSLSGGRWTQRVRLVRGEGCGVSAQYGRGERGGGGGRAGRRPCTRAARSRAGCVGCPPAAPRAVSRSRGGPVRQPVPRRARAFGAETTPPAPPSSTPSLTYDYFQCPSLTYDYFQCPRGASLLSTRGRGARLRRADGRAGPGEMCVRFVRGGGEMDVRPICTERGGVVPARSRRSVPRRGSSRRGKRRPTRGQ